jgi:long-chain-fatty-acid--[acyl-carrier-protein] ligase
VKPVTMQTVAQIVEEKIERPLVGNENTPGTTFMQLGIGSLDAMEVALHVEQRFGFLVKSFRTPLEISGNLRKD